MLAPRTSHHRRGSGWRRCCTLQSAALGFAVLISLAVAGRDALEAWDGRADILEHGAAETANLARSVARHAEDTIRTVDGVMIGLIERLETDGTGPAQLERLHRLLQAQAAALPLFKGFSVLDEDGGTLVSSQPMIQRIDHGGRAYFRFHRDHADLGLHIGAPVRGTAVHSWVIPLSRRFSRPDGSFGGVLVAAIDMAFFQAFYETFEIGTQGAIVLAADDGTLLVRHPFVAANVGVSLRNGPLFQHLPQAQTGTFEGPSAVDGVARLTSYRRIAVYPLVVAASQGTDELLADWRTEVRQKAVGAAMLIALISSLGWRIAQQVARRQRAEQAIEAMAAQYQILADNSRDMIIRLDLTLHRRYVSPACREQLGYEPCELIGTSPLATVHPDDAPALADQLRQMVSGLDAATTTNRFRHRDGRWIWVEAKLKLLRDPASGAPSEIIGTLRDVSLRQAAEQAMADATAAAEQATRAKSEFLATMSHEIRTPMTAILGFAGLLLDGELAPEPRRQATMIKDAGTSLLAIINDILDLSKIEAGRMELERLPASPAAVADAALSILRPQASAKGLVLVLDVAADVPAWVLGDATRLRQILVNLVGNALKFTERGRVGVTIRREPGADGALLRFDVSDTGIGVSAERQDRLFQTFSQVDRSTTRRYGGTGLGLAISKRLAEAMGGAMGMSSSVGAGSVFWFTARLPAAAPPTVAPPEPAVPGSRPLRILVAEDQAMNQILVEAILTAAGHRVAIVGNGAEAVEAVQAADFDIVLMDMEMPEMDGIAATQAIRRLGAGVRAIPIIALTANALPGEIARCRAAGMTDHLTKPIDRVALLRAIAIAVPSPADASM